MGVKEDIFSAEPVNKGRQAELDIAKAVITFLLAFIHCTIECTSEENLASGIPYLFDTIIGGPLAAPMFMFSMGVGMVYTKKNGAGDFAKRGLHLFISGFVLNLCRYTIPYLIGYAIVPDYDKYITPLLYRTLCNDILQFAGLSMLLIALLRRFDITDGFMLILSLGMSVAGMLCNGVDLGSVAGNIFFGFLVGTEDAAGMVFSDFPLLNWFIVPVCGYLFGKFLIRVKDRNKFYLACSPICLVVAAVYFIVGIRFGLGMFGEGQNCYYHISTNDVLASVAAMVGILGVYHFLLPWIPERLMSWMHDLSKNLTPVYCIHWVILVLVTNVWLYAARGTQELPVPAVMLLSFVISMVAIIIAHFWAARKKSHTTLSKIK